MFIRFFDFIGGCILKLFSPSKSMLSCLDRNKSEEKELPNEVKTSYFNGEAFGSEYSIKGIPLVYRERISDENSRCEKFFSIFKVSTNVVFYLYEEHVSGYSDLVGWGRFAMWEDVNSSNFVLDGLFPKKTFETETEQNKVHEIVLNHRCD